MSLEHFWRSTPRLTNLFVLGYMRRRAWSAFHAGYGIHCKDAELAHLLNGKADKEPMSPDQMLQNLRRHVVAQNARLKAREKAEGPNTGN